jgi:hypothetical protein
MLEKMNLRLEIRYLQTTTPAPDALMPVIIFIRSGGASYFSASLLSDVSDSETFKEFESC